MPLDRIRGCRFFGRVLLPLGFAGAAEVEDWMGGPPHPTGVYDSTLADCVVEADSLVKGNSLLSRVVVGQGAVVVGPFIATRLGLCGHFLSAVHHCMYRCHVILSTGNGLVACKGAEGTSFGCGVGQRSMSTKPGPSTPTHTRLTDHKQFITYRWRSTWGRRRRAARWWCTRGRAWSGTCSRRR